MKRQVLALTAGTGKGDQPSEWERVTEHGHIESLLLHPPSPRRARQRVVMDEETD